MIEQNSTKRVASKQVAPPRVLLLVGVEASSYQEELLSAFFVGKLHALYFINSYLKDLKRDLIEGSIS